MLPRFARVPRFQGWLSAPFSWVLVVAMLVATFQSPQVGLSADKEEPKEEPDVYELLELFADSLDQIDRNYVKDIDRRKLMEAAIRGMVEELDQYSNYIPPEELEKFRTGVEAEFGGIGIQVTMEDGKLTIISPLFGTPAHREGLLAGDHIIKIEGKSTDGINLDDAIEKLKGEVGTKVTFTVKQTSGEEKTVTLTRETVKVETVIGATRNAADDTWNYMFDKENKVGYIRINAFSRRTADDLKTALKQLSDAGMRALIVDLRFNPGGLLSGAIEMCDMFIDDGRIVSTSGRNSPERVWNASKKGTYTDFPMVVMVNKYSASASEIFSACLQDHKRALVVGERTWGKGSVQNIIELEGGASALKLTTAGYLRPSGKNIHRYKDATEEDEWGVMPDEGYLVKLTTTETNDLLAFRRDSLIISDEKHDKILDRQFDTAIAYLYDKLGVEVASAEDAEIPPPPAPEYDEKEGEGEK